VKHEETQTISIRLPKHLVDMLDGQAQKQRRSRSNLVALALQTYVLALVGPA